MATPATMRDGRACHPRDVPSALTCTHTQTIAGERESARAGETERKREAIGLGFALHIVQQVHLPGTSGEGQWEPGESRHVRAWKCSAHEAVCMQL
jgi:hypothetical protein